MRQAVDAWFFDETIKPPLHNFEFILLAVCGVKESGWKSVGRAREDRDGEMWSLFPPDPVRTREREMHTAPRSGVHGAHVHHMCVS